MEPKRHIWLRSRHGSNGGRAVEKPFRSDNDLYQLWMWVRIAGPTTLLCYGALRNLGVPFDYTPLAVIPAVVFYVVLRLIARRDTKKGKRFSQYDPNDMPN